MTDLHSALRLLALLAVLAAATWTRSLHTRLDAANAIVEDLTARAARDRETVEAYRHSTAQLADLLDRERATQARLLSV